MVCFACLLPLFLVPIVNILPLLLDFLLAKVYRLLGKEYRKPERVPPACPFRPSQEKGIKDTNEPLMGTPHAPHDIPRPAEVIADKSE